MKILNEYPGSHHYWDEFVKGDYFCPFCGKQEVWESQDSGDYYVGSEQICATCGARLHLDHCQKTKSDANYLGQLKQLREGKAAEPTTRPGR